MLKALVGVILLCLLSSSVVAGQQQNNKVIYVVSEQWESFSHTDGSGLYFDLFRAIYQPAGFTVIPKIQPLLRGIASINRGDKADVMLAEWAWEHIGDLRLYQRDKILYPVNAIYGEYVQAVFLPEANLSWAKVRADANCKVAWIRGYGYGELLGVQNHNITYLASSQQGLKMLASKNIDAYINDRQEIEKDMSNPVFKQLHWQRELIMMRKLYPLFHNSERGRYLLEIFDRRMQQMRESGELFKLYASYGEDYLQTLAAEVSP